MWEMMIDLLFGIWDGIDASKENPDNCFGCMFQAISIVGGLFSAVLLLILGITWLVELF